jgi:anti-sigma B factor antagonist
VEPAGRVVLGDGEASFRAAIHRALDHGTSSILIDFRRVDILDSSGIGALLSAQRTVSGRGGEIKLVHLRARVHDLLRMTEVLSLFDVYEDEMDALESFDARRA